MSNHWVVIVVNAVVPQYQIMGVADWDQASQGYKQACTVLGKFDTEKEANAFFQRQHASGSPH